jgi:hypothetical protein
LIKIQFKFHFFRDNPRKFNIKSIWNNNPCPEAIPVCGWSTSEERRALERRGEG